MKTRRPLISGSMLAILPFATLLGCSGSKDSDGDGIPDQEEIELGLDPNSADSDGDGIDDLAERDGNTDPLKADTDSDGLSDGDELANDADPLNPDTDGDGLLDGDEIAHGADPNVIDTDGDGYTDRDEVFEEKDPADPNSVIYRGGWPYYFEKTDIKGGGTSGFAEVGKRFGRFEYKDQFGDTVSLFDFYNSDKPIVIDVSALWCPPCNGLAEYIGGEDDPYGFGTIWSAGPEVIARGDVYWITVLGEGYSGGTPASKPDATEWSEIHPAEAIPVLADNAYGVVDYVQLRAWPALVLLDPDLKVAVHDPNYYPAVLYALAEQFPE